MSVSSVERVIATIEKLLAIARDETGASLGERERARKQADSKMAKLGLSDADFAYLDAVPAPRVEPVKRERKSARANARTGRPVGETPPPEPTPAPAPGESAPKVEPSPVPKPKGSKGRRDWNASSLKLARQAIWDHLTSDEISAHKERLKLTGGPGEKGNAAAKRAWAQTVKDGVLSGSLAEVEAQSRTVLAWAAWDLAS
jgi:hypothetical protein